MSKKNYTVVEPDGTECPRCFAVTETRQHTYISQKLLNQPFYFKRWYTCKNQQCKTTTFMLEDWKVFNNNLAAKNFKMIQEDLENQERIKLF